MTKDWDEYADYIDVDGYYERLVAEHEEAQKDLIESIFAADEEAERQELLQLQAKTRADYANELEGL